MHFIFTFLMLFVSPTENSARISKCFRTFAGTEIYRLGFSERKALGSTVTTEFKLANGKRVSIYFQDTYEAQFLDQAGELGIEYEVVLTQTTKYKDYLISNFSRMIDHHAKDHASDIILDSFSIDNHEFVGFTAGDHMRSLLGNYNYFPDNKTAVSFRFLNTKNLNINSIEDYIRIRDSFLKTYVQYLKECQTK